MQWAAIIAGAVSLITSLLGAGKDAEAASLRKQIADQYGEGILPHLDAALAQQQQGTQLAGITEDPTLRGTQLSAMRALEDEYAKGGMSDSDVAALRLVQNNAAANASSDYQSLAQGLAARGMGGGVAGAMLGAQAGQNATNTAANAGLQMQASARQRALQALEAASGIAGGVRAQDYNVASDRARAQDAINQFNTGLKSSADAYNRALPQANFDNLMQMYGARANALNGVATGYENAANGMRQTGGGLANATLSYGAALDQQDRKKGGG